MCLGPINSVTLACLATDGEVMAKIKVAWFFWGYSVYRLQQLKSFRLEGAKFHDIFAPGSKSV